MPEPDHVALRRSSTYHPFRTFWAIIAPKAHADLLLEVLTHRVAVRLAVWNFDARVRWEWAAHNGHADLAVEAEALLARVYVRAPPPVQCSTCPCAWPQPSQRLRS